MPNQQASSLTAEKNKQYTLTLKKTCYKSGSIDRKNKKHKRKVLIGDRKKMEIKRGVKEIRWSIGRWSK